MLQRVAELRLTYRIARSHRRERHAVRSLGIRVGSAKRQRTSLTNDMVPLPASPSIPLLSRPIPHTLPRWLPVSKCCLRDNAALGKNST